MTFTNPGEQALDCWMSDYAFVAWTTADEPWLREHRMLQSGLILPLNIRDNPSQRHTRVISEARRKAVVSALACPIVADSANRRRTTPETAPRGCR